MQTEALDIAMARTWIKWQLAGRPLVRELNAARDYYLSKYEQARANAAVLKLTQLGDPRAVEPLIGILGSEDTHSFVVAAAIRALGELGDPRAVEPLIGILGSGKTDPFESISGPPPRNVVAVAMRALGTLGDRRAFAPISQFLGSDASWEATYQLDQYGWKDTGHDGPFAGESLAALGDPRCLDFLIEALDSDSLRVCEDAATGLGRLGDPRAVGPLIELLGREKKKSDHHLEYYAAVAATAKALGRLGDPRALEPLVRVLHQEDEGKLDYRSTTAAFALGAIGDPRAVGQLRRAYDRQDRGPLRSACEQAARQLGEELVVKLRRPSCSFCGRCKPRDGATRLQTGEISHLVDGPAVSICEECVRKAKRALRRTKDCEPLRFVQVSAERRCSFCNKNSDLALAPARRSRRRQAAICSACVKECVEVLREKSKER